MSGPSAQAGRWTAFATVLTVTDLKASVAYYTDRLGFRVKLQWGEPAVYAIIEREGIELHLSSDSGTPGAGRIYIYADGIDAVHVDLSSRGARLEGPPVTRPYGMRDFNAVDLDGNILSFGEEANSTAVSE